VQDSYGGPDGLKRFVDACHGHGLAACLDVVYNHLGPEGNHLREFGPYFTDRYRTPWGDAVNVDGAWSDEVRRFFIDNAVEWFEDYHVDALRLDAIDWILDVSASPFLRELADRIHGLDLGRPLHLIAETDLGDPRVVKPADAGGLGHDAQWADDFHHAAHALLTGERGGYYQDFGRPEDLTVAYRDGYVYQGRYSTFRRRRHGAPTAGLPAERFVVFAQNHDQVGNHPFARRLSQLVDFESLKLAAGCFLLSPFVPLLFMGEEYGELAPFHYFVDHSDPKIIQAVLRGRRAELASFGCEGRAPDPQDEATFERCKLDHALKDKDQHRQLRELYRELLRLRREVPPLAEMDRNACMPLPARGELLSILRAHGEDRVIIRLSFGHEAVSEPAPPGRWRTLLDSADVAWNGPGSEMPAVIDGASSRAITQRPRSVVVLQSMPEAARA
jgi:maltooligosyltrehalose trehalohydrolase